MNTPQDSIPPMSAPATICRQAKTALWLGAGNWLLLMLFIGILNFGVTLRARDDQEFFRGITAAFLGVTGWLAVAALVMGFKAAKLIKSNPALKGAALARSGGLLGGLYLLLILVSVATPDFVPARTTSGKNACISNLRQIDGAKEQWALEHKKTLTDTPVWSDLVGNDKYLPQAPICDKKGRYTINAVGSYPNCSVASHTLP